MHTIDLKLLGEFVVTVDNQRVPPLPTGKTRALLAYLVLESSRSHSRSALSGLFWPDASEKAARTNLRNTLYRLRDTLDKTVAGASAQVLEVSNQAVRFNPVGTTVDVLSFQALLSAQTTHKHASLAECSSCMANLAAATDLYRGELLQGLYIAEAPFFDEWLLLRREYLQLQALRALIDLAAALEAQHRYPEAHALAARLLDLDPFREETHRQVMRLLALQGMPEKALVQFDKLRKLLREELGGDPDQLTTDLVRQISAGAFTATPATITTAQVPATDWSDAPLVGPFFGRDAEVAQLQQWLLQDRCQLVAILGMGGVGKSTLATYTARAVSGHFDAVLWRSLINAPTLHELLASVVQVLSAETLEEVPDAVDKALAQLMGHLRQRRCLLVLDNLESILDGESAGRFRPGYEDYGQLLTGLAPFEHQSCVLLTSRERPRAVGRLERTTTGVHSLPVSGLDAESVQQIAKEQGLAISPEVATTLARRYSGNPLALNLVIRWIQDLYLGNADFFLSDGTPIFADIRDILEEQISRLAPLEQQIVYWLAVAREPLTAAELKLNLVGANNTSEVLEAMRGLQRRSLLEKTGNGFGLQNVVTEYLTSRLVEQVGDEIQDGHIDLLDRYALLHTQAREMTRQSQRRLFLDPILQRLAEANGSVAVADRLQRVLDSLRSANPKPSGYAIGNILNLMLQAEVDMTGRDFSRSSIRKADLRGMRLPDVSFAGADFDRCSFTDTANIITSVGFSPDGRLLAAASADHVIRLWRVADGMLAATLHGHTYVVMSVAFSPDGHLLASASLDGTVRIWDYTSGTASNRGTEWAVLTDHEGGVLAVAFNSDGSVLASSSRDNTVRLWDIGNLLGPGCNPSCQILRGHTDFVEAVSFSPDDRLLATGSSDKTIHLWELTPAPLPKASAASVLVGHDGPVTSLAFDPGGKTLVSTSNDGTVRLWDLAGGQCRHVLHGHRNWVTSVAFDPNGRTVASASIDRAVLLWDVADPLVLAGDRSPHILRDHTDWVRSVAFSPDGRLLASGGDDKTVRTWDVRTRQVVRLHQGFKNRVMSIAFSPDGLSLASGSEDGVPKLWRVSTNGTKLDLASAKTLSPSAPVDTVAFHPDGQTLVACIGSAPIRGWDASTGALRFSLTGHSGALNCLAFSHDGRYVVAGGEDHGIYIWQVHSHAGSNRPRILRIHTQGVQTLVFSPDGRTLASGASDGVVCLWDTESWMVRHTFTDHTNWVNGLAFNPAGDLLASGSADTSIHLRDVVSGMLRQVLRGHVAWVRSVTFSPDGRLLASGGNDKVVRLWDLASGETKLVLEGHEDMVWSLAFNPHGQMLASGSADETVRLWNPITGECVYVQRMPGPYQGMDITGASGLSDAQRAALQALGSVERGF